jgi:SHS2 domain-containing protein
MYLLMAVEVSDEARRHHHVEIQADDGEQLVVSFLEELLFLVDTDRLAFYGYLLQVEDTQLSAHLEGGFAVRYGREIKAVTYHDLEITRTESGLRTHIVFDV